MLIIRDHNNGDGQSTAVVMSIARLPNGWKITDSRVDPAFEFVFDEKALEFVPDIAFLSVGSNGPELSWASEIYASRDGLAHSLQRKLIKQNHTIATFAVDETGESHCFLNGESAAIVYDGEVALAGNHIKSPIEVIDFFVPQMRKFVRRMLLKKKLLGRINPLDSLAALESQVDILTGIVAQLAAAVPPEKRPPGINQLMQAVTGVTTDAVRPVGELLEDLRQQKAHIRSQQETYFAGRQAIDLSGV